MAWLEQHIPGVLLWLTILSLLTLAATVLAVPWVISRLPADYFCQPRRKPLPRQPGAAGYLLGPLKNLFGLLLLLLGLVMLFTPGQGLLTMLLGLLLMNFPGKYRLERALARNQGVLKALNWMRQQRGNPPFEAPENTH